ncbi:MAG: amidohydrolase family protein [Gemmatimonadota bacterium]
MRTVAPKIDLHTHILPERWPDLSARYGYQGFVRLEHTGPGCACMMIGEHRFREVGANTWDPGVRLGECDRDGVRVQVLSTVPVMFSYWAKPRDTLDLSRLLNDHLAGVVAEHPTRFTALGTLPMQAPELAAQELERCVKELGFPGVQIGSHVNDWNLDEPALLPFYEAAEALGAAVFVHPWDMLAPERMRRYWMRWLVGMPTETTIAICSLVFGGIFERFPKLRVAFAHGGGSFPGTIGRIEHGFQVRPDLCATQTRIPPTDWLGRFWVDSLVHEPAALRMLLEVVGEDRIALGSDYPFPLGEHVPGKMIEEMADLTPEVRTRLLTTNALEFLDIPVERFTQ